MILTIIIELKRGKGTQVAIDQIISQEYASKLFDLYKRNVLIVGIDYTEGKDHSCQVMELKYR